ncbi:RidA family protein [Nocardia rhamnosiphila]
MTPRERLAVLGLELPAPPPPKGAYFPSRLHGGQLWISGCTSRSGTDPGVLGVIGDDLSLEDGKAAAERAALNLLGAIDTAVGLNSITALLHLRGYVRAVPTFAAQPAVVDGASKLLFAVFGDSVGAHARTALGVASLPGGACVELDLVVSISD